MRQPLALALLLPLVIGCPGPPAVTADRPSIDAVDVPPPLDRRDEGPEVDELTPVDRPGDDRVAVLDADDLGGMDGDEPEVADAGDDAAADDLPSGDLPPFDAPAPVCPGPLLGTLVMPAMEPVTIDGMTGGTSRNAAVSCVATTDGPEDFYRLDVIARSVVTLSTEGATTDFDSVLALRRDCASAASEVACNDDSPQATTTASRLRAVLDVGSYGVVVDGVGESGGRYRLAATGTPVAANGACSRATTLTPGIALRGQAVDGGYDSAFACLPVPGAGQLFYELTVPPGMSATVTATPSDVPARWAPIVRVYDRCGAAGCVGAAAASAPGAAAVTTVNNDGAAPRSYRVAVSPSSAGASGRFDVSAAVGPPRPGSACSSPRVLVAGVDARGSLGDATVATSVCRPAAVGAVVYYQMTVPAGTRVDLEVAPEAEAVWTPVVRVLDDCDATACAFDGQGSVAGAPFAFAFANVTAASRSFVIAVGASLPATGGFTLRARTSALTDGARCSAPAALLPESPLLGRNLAAGVDRVTACRPSASGRVQYYGVDVPPRSVATLRVTPSTLPGWTPTVRMQRACDGACVYDTLGAFAAPSTHTYANESTAAERLFVSVGATLSSSTGTYDLALEVTPIATGEVCSQPTPLVPGTLRRGERLQDGRLPPTVCRLSGGPVRYFALPVSGQQAYSLRVLPVAAPFAWAPQVRVFEGCLATTCEFDAAGPMSTELTLTGVNESAAPRTYVVAVNAASTMVPTGTYDILATVFDPAPGTLCAAPIPLPTAAPLMGQSTLLAATSSNACLTASNGGQLFYSLRVPPGQRARVAATPATGTTTPPVLRALDGCAAASCAASVTGSSAGAALDLPNYDTAPRDLIVTLGTTARTLQGTYALATSFAPVREGQFCERATALIAGTTARGSTADGVTTAFGCLGGSFGPQWFYRVTVPAARSVTVSAAPLSTTAALRLRAVASCATAACLATSPVSPAGMPAVLTLNNPTLSDRQVFFSVASAAATVNTDFTLSAREAPLLPAPGSDYDVTLITGACDVLGGAGTVTPPGGWSDDSVSAIARLPFALRFFGDTATRFAVSANGNLQLFDDASGVTSPASANAALPASALPNGLVAPFWDDFGADGASVVRTATLGAPGARRFVVEWRNWRFAEEPGAPLNFQAKLFEGTGVVEFHYCPTSSVGTERTLGASATVGLEDLVGGRGALVSLDWPNTTRPGNGWRLTPR